MSHKKLSRNAPCPCGSGKKHKHCCLAREERGSQSRADGVALAIDWLGQRHRKALTRALDDGFFGWNSSIMRDQSSRAARNFAASIKKFIPTAKNITTATIESTAERG